MYEERPYVDEGVQKFLDEQEYRRSWRGNLPRRIEKLLKVCEKILEVIFREEGVAAGEGESSRLESIKKNLKYIADNKLFSREDTKDDSENDPTLCELYETFDAGLRDLYDKFAAVLGEKRDQLIFSPFDPKLDEVDFTLKEAYDLLTRVSMRSGELAELARRIVERVKSTRKR